MLKSFQILFLLFPFMGIGQIMEFVRGPYLQITGPNSTYVCWKTTNLCFSKVTYGTNKYNLNLVSYNSVNDTMHTNILTSLTPNTKYYYIINKNLIQMSSDTFYFYTAPSIGSGQKIRILALGDCGTNYTQQYNVKAAANYFRKNNYINCVLLLGDNAYNSGLQSEYQSGFFNPYYSNFIFNNSCIYPSPGNHDYANDLTLSQNHLIPYFDIFKTPQLGELGGVASNHKEFYSYNYGNTHFISLDSYGIELGIYHLWDSLGPQYKWLEQDLIQDKSMWKIVYFHHPPFTMGSHNSDLESDLILVRTKIARLLEKYGVDLVINGHSHNYERSYLQKGHYDLEATFNKYTHTLDSSSALYNGSSNSCPYKKDSSDNKGTVYIVAGSSGKLGITQASYPHNCMYYSDSNKSGALFLEIEQNRLDAYYIEEDSLVHDKFTIFKNVNKNIALNTFSGLPTIISSSWIGTYNWLFNGAHTKTQTVNLSVNTQFIVKDSLNCLADTINLNITGINENIKNISFKIYPNPIKDKIYFEIPTHDDQAVLTIFSLQGKSMFTSKIEFNNKKAELSIANLNLPNSEYIITLNFSEKSISKSILIER